MSSFFSTLQRLTYTEAITLLEKAYNEDGVEFEVKPEWGIDLPSEHERRFCTWDCPAYWYQGELGKSIGNPDFS